MRSLLLLSAVLIVATAQPWTSPPHLLFTPQRYYVGTEATFTLTCYTTDCRPITLTLSYQECTCDDQFGRQTCSGDVLYAEDTEEANPIFDSQPITLKVKLPSLSELPSRRYYVSITTADGQFEFLSRRQISFYNNQFGHMLVKTDKPIYKPAQTVNICVVFLDASLRPHNADSTVEVIIKDSKYKQIMKTTVTVLDGEGVGCMDIALSDEPNLGTWTVDAHLVMDDVGSGQCQFYSYYSLPRSSCRFKVDEFVLPKFEVTLDGPKQIERNQNKIEGTISATYTFGEQVQGTVRVNATLTSATRRETFLFYDNTAPLVNGEYPFSIPANMYRDKVRYRYDPFCVRSSINIVAEVTEEGRNTTQSSSLTLPLVASPVTVRFDESNPTVFRPGLPYTVKGMATLADGSPAVGKEIELKGTANNGQITLVDRIIRTDRNGKIEFTVDTTQNTNCIKFTMSPVLFERTCDNQMVCFSPSPMYSPTNSFLQLENVSPFSLSPGVKASITAKATFPFNSIHVVVIGQGNIQLHQAQIPNGNRARKFTFSIPITQAGVPRVKVLGVVARIDGELVADLIEIPVTCQLEHEVDVSFGVGEAAPGDEVSIVTTADPGSVVVLGVIDKSLTLLADACKSVDTDNVCGLLRDLTGGYKPSSASCSVESESTCCPNTCNEPSKRAVANIFSAAGINLNTNMFQPNPPFTPNRRPFPDFEYDFPTFEFAPAPPAFRPDADAPTLDDAAPGVPEPEGDGESTEVRDFFPETWVFEILRTNKSGVAVFESEVPDTITTWNAEAFAINRNTGLGISPLTQLLVKKDVFVSLELPFSIIFKETVTVTPVIFNFGSNPIVIVHVNVTVDSELDVVENELDKNANGLVSVEQGGGTSFSLKLKPRAIGRLSITICIREFNAPPDAPCIDAVRKYLFVKPGCERFAISSNIYASENLGEHCFNYSLPSCVVPGSQKATISVTGDLLSPPDLDHLLVLPYGCGEQNMVRFSLNIVVGHYLMATDQLPDFLAVKILNNLQTGYQRQLTYLQIEGCFSIWTHSKCSVWLTAFTARFFIEAADPGLTPALGLSEQTELVDPAVIRGAIQYLISQQERSGRFPVIGFLPNYYLMEKDNFVGLTGFVLITLRTASALYNSTVQDAIEKAEEYILEQYNNKEVEFCNYGLAITTTAMALGGCPAHQSNLTCMVDDLKSRIQDSKSYPGACFLCNDCPGDEETTTDSASCSSRPRGEGSSSCVETTGYALRALLTVGDTDKTVCLAQWLVQVKSSSGGFYSSQDTLVALDALRWFAEQTFTTNLNKQFSVDINGLPTVTHDITDVNRYEWRHFEVPFVPSESNCVSYSGAGTAIIQSTLEFHGCNCCDDTDKFSLNLATRVTGKQFVLYISVSYEGEGESNMVIVDVEVPSGYVYSGHEDTGGVIERTDRRGSSVVFYINEIEEGIVFTVEFAEDFPVENYQQVPVTVYDYYDPDQIVTKYYLPIDSGTPPSPTPTISPPPFSNGIPTVPPLGPIPQPPPTEREE